MRRPRTSMFADYISACTSMKPAGGSAAALAGPQRRSKRSRVISLPSDKAYTAATSRSSAFQPDTRSTGVAVQRSPVEFDNAMGSAQDGVKGSRAGRNWIRTQADLSRRVLKEGDHLNPLSRCP